MTAYNDLTRFLVWTLPETAMGILQYGTPSWATYRIPGIQYVIRSFPLCGVRVHPARHGDLRNKKEKHGTLVV